MGATEQGFAGIEVDGLHRSFGTVKAVDDMVLRAAPGEVTALVGPNGAGKTTLLLILATLLAPDKGNVRVAGHDLVASPQAVRCTATCVPGCAASARWAQTLSPQVLEVRGRSSRGDGNRPRG